MSNEHVHPNFRPLLDSLAPQEVLDVDYWRTRCEAAEREILRITPIVQAAGDFAPKIHHCDTCQDTREVDETLGGSPGSNAHAPCPDCQKFGKHYAIVLDGREISVSESRQFLYVGPMVLDIEEAKQLRDILNKVVPCPPSARRIVTTQN